MAERVEFGIEPEYLEADNAPSPRFSYSYWFVGLSNAGVNGREVLTKNQFVTLALVAGLDADDIAELWRSWHENEMFWPGHANRMAALTHRDPDGPDDDDPILAFLRRQPADVGAELRRSELGLLFMDRTRILESGPVVGEHLTSLSIAPGEEMNVEQTSFWQREVSDEKTTEREASSDTETTSSTNLETADALAGTSTTSRTDGFSAGGTAGFEYGVHVGVQANLSDTATDADNSTRNSSTKAVAAATTKNAAKLRDAHKTTFRVATTDRLERTSRRTLKNPNPHTAIDLHAYKVLQRTEFSHERYGVRLCWTPYLRDPAGAYLLEEAAKRTAMIAQAVGAIPEAKLPAQPHIADVPGAKKVGIEPPLMKLTAWGGFPGADMSHDYVVPINVPDKMKWDGDIVGLQSSLRITLTGQWRAHDANPVGDPWEIIGFDGKRTIFQIVHVGAQWCAAWWHTELYLSLEATVIPDSTSLAEEQAKALEKWEASCAVLRSEHAAKVALATADAEAEFAIWRSKRRALLNPAMELWRRFVVMMFPPDARDEIGELDLWNEVFDWDLASARLYSGLWNGDGNLRDPTRPAEDFVNASWARLYLPVRPGRELAALNWLLLGSLTGPAPGAIAALTAAVQGQLSQWRIDNLGGTEEVTVTPNPAGGCPAVEQQYVCLGHWSEDVPTDGVHLEVTVGTTSAADEDTAAAVVAGAERSAAQTASIFSDSELRAAVGDADFGSIDVRLHVDRPDS